MEAYYVICRYFCFSLFFERSSLSSVFQRSTGSWAPCEEFTLLRNIILYKTFFKIWVFDLTKLTWAQCEPGNVLHRQSLIFYFNWKWQRLKSKRCFATYLASWLRGCGCQGTLGFIMFLGHCKAIYLITNRFQYTVLLSIVYSC